MVELEADTRAAPLTWSPEQVGAFLEQTADDRLAFLWRLALLRGFRRGELYGMGEGDMDLDDACIRVCVALLPLGGTLVWGTPKSNQLGHSTTRITQDLYQHVRRQVHQDAAEKVVALAPRAPEGAGDRITTECVRSGLWKAEQPGAPQVSRRHPGWSGRRAWDSNPR
jgi:hypothetical protein